MSRPNVLLIMTDQERYPPGYEGSEVAAFPKERLGARRALGDRDVESHRHYVGSTACLPSRATVFTGQYPSLHGVRNTDGIAKLATDPDMGWLDPDMLPTIGDWFRAGGDTLPPPWPCAEQSGHALAKAGTLDATVVVFPRGDHRLQKPETEAFVDGYLSLLGRWTSRRAC